MLLQLHIKNFALIDDVNIDFYNGLNILTGETGAGKSILIDSVNFVLGEKQSKDIIRTDEESAYVEAVFESSDEINEILNLNGIESDDVLIISREINLNGRTVSRINNRTVTVNLLKQISGLLIDIHGQHEHQSLLNENSYIDILDSFCTDGFKEVKNEFKDIYHKVKEIEKEIEKLEENEEYKSKRMDLLKYQIQEISEAGLKNGEDEELIKRRNILSNAERIYSSLSLIYSELYGGENRECAYDKIGTSIANIEIVEKYDEKLKDIKSSMEDVYYKLEDIIDVIRDYKDSIEFDSEELERIESRLDLINNLKRKYGSNIESILSYLIKIKDEFSLIERNEEIIEKYKEELERLNLKLYELTDKITDERKQTALKLEKLIENELKYLGMGKALFKIVIDKKNKLTDNGIDDILFTMTANPGEPLKPLNKVASGGEMSRIMLAIKTVIADIDKIPTLIFDEIDTGISGRTAQCVAEKMSEISKSHQILCVTHLPQIASMADIHFKIEKDVNKEKTFTKVYKLDDNEKIEELSRMLSGAQVTNITRSHAKEMIELAQKFKKQTKKLKF
ncbi:DNA replication and repair protein RecN [Caloramator quimbayensis]|uniref:DNA repair protein RecN n=1 Tax=Caloramator quimbayensis TaxID=1147123 RepID=A0A1T4WY22_9CLOT|nr:DNA repair protein RecN [Caloramator quimbayensis]SKA82057.1 DNA replication and repair protein RecN [Caloramator quimbayensis]